MKIKITKIKHRHKEPQKKTNMNDCQYKDERGKNMNNTKLTSYANELMFRHERTRNKKEKRTG